MLDPADASHFAECLHEAFVAACDAQPSHVREAEDLLYEALAAGGLTLSTAVLGALAEACLGQRGKP